MAPQQTEAIDSQTNVIDTTIDTHEQGQQQQPEDDVAALEVQNETNDANTANSTTRGETAPATGPATEGNLEVPDQQSTVSAGSGTSSNQELSDGDGSREEDGSDPGHPDPDCEMRERRDSGVGSSLTRAPR